MFRIFLLFMVLAFTHTVPFRTQGYAIQIATGSSVQNLESNQYVDAPPFSDPANDLFDQYGNAVKAEACMDILSIDIRRSGKDYVLDLFVGGYLPGVIAPPLWMEWDIFMDIDNNPNTGWKWTLLLNDIGADYVIRVGMANSTYYPEIRETSTWKLMTKPKCDISGNRITFSADAIPGVAKPTMVAAVGAARKYGNAGQPPDPPLLAADKVPNIGHFTVSLESIRIEDTTTLRIRPDQILDHMLCRNNTGPPDWMPVERTYNFNMNDVEAMCWVQIKDVPKGVSFGFKWYGPGDSLWRQYYYPPTSSPSAVLKIDHRIAIRGTSVTNMPGMWKVEVYAGEQPLFTHYFGIWAVDARTQSTTSQQESSTIIKMILALAFTVMVIMIVLLIRRKGSRAIYLNRLEELKKRNEISELTYQQLKNDYVARVGLRKEDNEENH